MDKILIWDSVSGHYSVFGAAPSEDSIASPITFPQEEYVASELRINGLRETGKDNRRSGDIVLLMKDKITDSIDQRYATGAACMSWHGSLNPSDSYVPLIMAYPGGTKDLITDQQEKACNPSGCKGNWSLGELVRTIIDAEFK